MVRRVLWNLLIVAYLVMAFLVGSSRSRCGEATDQIGLHNVNPVRDTLYGLIWPVSMVIYWGQHDRLADFFSRAQRADCS